MYINGKNAELYGAHLLSEYKYTPPAITAEYFRGRRRSDFSLLNTDYDLGTLDLPVIFEGKNRKDVLQKKSSFEQLCFGKTNIAMEDGFEYFAVLTSIGQTGFAADELADCSYTFSCIRHGAYIQRQGNHIFCESTLPYTDCVLTVEVGQDGTNYQVGPVLFHKVFKGQVLTVDGIEKRIMSGGAPDAQNAEWIRFPSLVPGENTFSCLDELTIGYYPSYF